MRIAAIAVRGLFGLFSYTIPLKMEDRITIIHGPNGCGKTTVLRMLFDLFGRRFGDLGRTLFDELHIAFDDGQQLKIIKTEKTRQSGPQTSKRRSTQPWQLEFSSTGGEQQRSWTWVGISEVIDFPLGVIETHLPFLSRIEPAAWQDHRTDEILSLEDVLVRFSDRLPFVPALPGQEMPHWLKAIIDGVEVHFIQTQRLLRLASHTRERGERARHRAMVLEFSEEAVGQIRSALAESVQQSQKLDRNFPVRVLTERGSVDVTSEEIRTRYQAQQQKRSRLQDAGLISWQIEVPLPDRDLEEVERQLLWLYLEDMDKKLSGFNTLLEKIEVLTEMINSRFLNKDFKIDREKGFVFKTRGTPIPLESLSSGEQHELVLSFELLFRVKRGSLILIDEPELSLHVAWQHRFLEDLRRISELAGLDFLVATHSPQIIHKRWDLALSLGPTE